MYINSSYSSIYLNSDLTVIKGNWIVAPSYKEFPLTSDKIFYKIPLFLAFIIFEYAKKFKYAQNIPINKAQVNESSYFEA